MESCGAIKGPRHGDGRPKTMFSETCRAVPASPMQCLDIGRHYFLCSVRTLYSLAERILSAYN